MIRVLILVSLVLFATQIPMAVFVYVDAKRLNVEPTRRTQYEMGTLLAMVGVVFFAHYLLNRQELDRRENEQTPDET